MTLENNEKDDNTRCKFCDKVDNGYSRLPIIESFRIASLHLDLCRDCVNKFEAWSRQQDDFKKRFNIIKRLEAAINAGLVDQAGYFADELFNLETKLMSLILEYAKHKSTDSYNPLELRVEEDVM